MLIVARKVLDKLLSYSRTALLGIIEVQEHIEKGGESTLVVNTVMGVETLILRSDEAVADVLRYGVDINGDTLEIVLYLVHYLILGIAVLVRIRAVEEGIASRFELLKRYAGGVVHKVEDVDRQGSTYYRSRDNYYQNK